MRLRTKILDLGDLQIAKTLGEERGVLVNPITQPGGRIVRRDRGVEFEADLPSNMVLVGISGDSDRKVEETYQLIASHVTERINQEAEQRRAEEEKKKAKEQSLPDLGRREGDERLGRQSFMGLFGGRKK